MSALSVGITCYHTFGGSGIIATEIGLELARRGHRVHFICAEPPARLAAATPNVFFHAVALRDYPLLLEGQYPLALASRMVDVALHEGLDLFHVHYAVPHATSAYLARQILGARAPRLVTTLHGTDITLVGNDRSYLPITRFSIERSDGVTAPSQYLARATRENFSLDRAIEVIPNFVDTERFAPSPRRRAPGAPALLVHGSNFRTLKRVDDVVEIFARVRRRRPARLALVGDGPERPRVEAELGARGLLADVELLGERLDFVSVLQAADVFLLPSETESFGLAALEALSCGVPVVASRVGGLPEVVRDGEDGFLFAVGDVEAMAAAAARLCDDTALRRTMGEAARAGAVARFSRGPMVTRYEACYERVLRSSPSNS